MKNQCHIYSNSNDDLNKAADKIIQNKLIIFPSETVYGLGANALSDEAIRKIYEIKKRTTTNPLIVHCLGIHDSLTLCNLSQMEEVIFKQLATKFWPGPLTMVVRSKNIVSKLVTAGSEFIAIRVPNQKTTLNFIKKCGVPIAAPSANISGKVSCTTIEHLKNYFNSKNIGIIDDDNYISKYGVESTVIKINNNSITILRPGTITKNDIQRSLNDLDQSFIVSYQESNNIDSSSPGQNISHYCPDKPVFILNIVNIDLKYNDSSLKEELSEKTGQYFKNCVLIDFNSLCFKYRDKFLGYVDLSKNGDLKEALYNVYNVFHQINSLDCDKVYIYNFKFIEKELNTTLWNRLWRAAEGKEIAVPESFLV